MTKFQLMLTSLVAVIPAALLCVVLGLAVLNHTLPTMAYVIVGGTLLVGAVTVLMPLGIVIGGGRGSAAAKPAAKKPVSEEAAVLDDEVEIDDAAPLSVAAASEDEFDADVVSSEFDFGQEGDDEESHLETEAEVETEPLEDFDDFNVDAETEGDDLGDIDLNFDDDEEEEPPEPKKKKR